MTIHTNCLLMGKCRSRSTGVETECWCVQVQLVELIQLLLFKGHKIWSRKNVRIIFVFVTSIEGTHPAKGKGHFFWVPKPGLTSIQEKPLGPGYHSGDI